MAKRTNTIRLDKRKLRRLEPTQDAFHSLVRSIISQQLSTTAAASIRKKFLTLFSRKRPTPKAALQLSDEQFQRAGISPQKRAYIRDLARGFSEGALTHRGLMSWSPEDVRAQLVAVKGIGPWTVDMFLIFARNHPDILPVGDLGIQKGFQKVFGLEALPGPEQMRTLAEPYQGERTYLALYLWDSLE